jgi:hypothetical protein
MNIKTNKAQCRKCDDVIVSEHRHDFRSCSCGAISVDGGNDYLRRSGEREYYIELSEYYDDESGPGGFILANN